MNILNKAKTLAQSVLISFSPAYWRKFKDVHDHELTELSNLIEDLKAARNLLTERIAQFDAFSEKGLSNSSILDELKRTQDDVDVIIAEATVSFNSLQYELRKLNTIVPH